MRVLPNLPKESNQLEKDFITISSFYKLMFYALSPFSQIDLHLYQRKVQSIL